MARFYHIDQSGAPALSYSTTSTAVNHWNSMVSVLKACLVSGFGSQPAAGWELVFEDANNLVLRNGSHTGYVCFNNTASGVFTVSVAETYLGVSGGFILGDGAKSGVSSGNTVPHRQAYRSFSHHISNCSWWVLADEKTFILSGLSTADTSNTELIGNSGAGYTMRTLYVGEDSAGNFIVAGGLNTTSIGSTSNFAFTAGFTTLRDPATGLLVDTSPIAVSAPGLFSDLNVISGGVTPIPEAKLCPVLWEANGVYNKYRGLCLEPRVAYYQLSIVSQKLGGASLFSRTAYTPLDLGDSHIYALCARYYSYGQALIGTTNPEFW